MSITIREPAIIVVIMILGGWIVQGSAEPVREAEERRADFQFIGIVEENGVESWIPKQQ